MPLLETKGAASAQGFGLTLGGAAPVYIEDVFSTWLYTGNGYPTSNTQSINNGIDLSTKGGLVWIKVRSQTGSNALVDTARGYDKYLYSNITAAQGTATNALTAFNNNGFSLGADSTLGVVNENTRTYTSWTFREQPKFFDVVTFTSAASGDTTFNHNLGSTPGFVIIKNTQRADSWYCYHRSLGNNFFIYLNLTNARDPLTNAWSVSSTQVTINSAVMYASESYVAYVFAHDAGGFGLTGTDNVISCGSFTTDGSGVATVNLGYEPQWVLFKFNSNDSWKVFDNMRGMSQTNWNELNPNTTGAEIARTNQSDLNIRPSATGFTITWSPQASRDCIYIAIRRGPMKTPTTGTSVFNPLARTGTGTNPTVVTTNNNPDLLMSFPRTASPSAYGMCFWDKLRGISPMLQSSITDPETNTNTARVLQGWLNTGYQAGADFIEGYLNYSGSDYVNYPITRAPGFFDVVCYTGTGSATTQAHNLGVVPEMIIIKDRISVTNWTVYTATTGTGKGLYLNSTSAEVTFSQWVTSTSSTTFGLGNGTNVNGSGDTYVAYLFATVSGVSKVGSYTGTGALQTINCGFTGGARFVLIKRTDSTGGWFTYDSARGITSGNDPYLLMNSAVAEVTGTNYVDTTSVGFQVTAAAPAGLNANGGTYIFLAIA